MRLTDSAVEELYKKYETPSWVISHCREVSRVGAAIAEALNKAGGNFDVELVRVSGLAHDVLRTWEDHDIEIGKLLEKMGYIEEARVVERHMRYSFNPIDSINETDIMCLADRIVKEDHYVGIVDRVDYLIHKQGETPERTERLLEARGKSIEYINQIEDILGYPIDTLFMDDKDFIESKLDKILKQVEKPARYIGGEKNIIVKDNQDLVRFGFAFPDIYEIGMSYLGLQILYNICNSNDGIAMERVFQPANDMAELMRKNKLPLFTLETKTPVKSLDVFGFTLQYEMSFTNILDMLNLGGITLKAAERGEEEPLIIAGGPCAYNPEPLTDFIDVFLIGDGEETLPEFLLEYKSARTKGITKAEFISTYGTRYYKGDNNNIAGVYIPSQYDVEYDSRGRIIKYIDKVSENQLPRTRRAILHDLDKADYPRNPIVPFIETVHDRAVVEAFRGCTRGCRFCQAGMIYRPIREREENTIIDLAIHQINNTGNDELSLLSLSSSDYSKFESLATTLTKECAARNVALSLPSLRLDTFSFSVLQEIQKYRKSGLTFAPEAGTQRLRDVINKGITEEDIYSAVSQAIDLGWTHIKLYFMIGLPTETYEDLDGIADIAKNIMDIKRDSGKGGRFSVTVSVSNFVPKPHTTFQWAAQDTAESFREKHNYLREKLKIKGVTFNYHDDDTSVLEAILARGDRRVGELLLSAYNKGCKMDSWTEYFVREKWDEAMKETGILPEDYATRERSVEEVLPWDIISSCISKEYLIKEREKSIAESTTHDCRYGCTGCGINKYTECKLGGIYSKAANEVQNG